MALEIDSIDDYGLDYGYSSSNYNQQPELGFYKSIFSPANYDEHFSRKPVFDTNRLPLDERIGTVFMNSSGEEKTMFSKRGKRHSGHGQFEGGGEITYSWGGKDGPKCEACVKGKVKDKHGNYIEAEVNKDEDGEASATVRAGNKSEDKASPKKKK